MGLRNALKEKKHLSLLLPSEDEAKASMLLYTCPLINCYNYQKNFKKHVYKLISNMYISLNILYNNSNEESTIIISPLYG